MNDKRNSEHENDVVQFIELGGRPYALLPAESLLRLVSAVSRKEPDASTDWWHGSGEMDQRHKDAINRSLEELISRRVSRFDYLPLSDLLGRHLKHDGTDPADESGEEAADIAAFDAAIEADEESFPDDMVRRLVAGAHPLKVHREYRGLTQSRLAAEAGTSPTYISQIETGRRTGSTKLWRRLARALDVDMDDLLSEPEPSDP